MVQSSQVIGIGVGILLSVHAELSARCSSFLYSPWLCALKGEEVQRVHQVI